MLASWASGDPCGGTWAGVTCSGAAVVRLQFVNAPLRGTLPPALAFIPGLSLLELTSTSLSGTLPTSLGQLAQLTSLALGRNSLSGSIPLQIGALTRLTSLELWGNRLLTGTLPLQLGALANLTRLSLDSCPCLYGPLVSVGVLGTTYHYEGDGTALGTWAVPAFCNATLPPPG